MLRKIKSLFILKKIFSNINNKRKYNTIVYNKKLHKKLGLDLIDFRRFSGKYKVEIDGKIKICNSYNDRLIYYGYYSIEKEMEKVNNIMIMVIQYLMGNIQKIKDGKEKKRYIMKMVN